MREAAVFTMVQNEFYWLSRWSRYYAEQIDPLDIYVLDHASRGDAADLLEDLRKQYGFTVLRLSHIHSYDHVWMTRTVRAFQEFLCSSYRVTLLADADECVVYRNGLLRDGLRQVTDTAVRVTGFDIVQTDKDRPLNVNEPVLSQRASGCYARRYSKLAIAAMPIRWHPGHFAASNVAATLPASRDFMLLHMHRADYVNCLQKHRAVDAREIPPDVRRAEGPYRHNLIVEPGMLQQWFKCDVDDTRQFARVVAVPEDMKGLTF